MGTYIYVYVPIDIFCACTCQLDPVAEPSGKFLASQCAESLFRTPHSTLESGVEKLRRLHGR